MLSVMSQLERAAASSTHTHYLPDSIAALTLFSLDADLSFAFFFWRMQFCARTVEKVAVNQRISVMKQPPLTRTATPEALHFCDKAVVDLNFGSHLFSVRICVSMCEALFRMSKPFAYSWMVMANTKCLLLLDPL